MPSPDSPVTTPEAVVEALTGSAPVTVERVLGGGNNQLYRVVDRAGVSQALKIYRSNEVVPRPRLQQEFAALSFLGELPGAPVPAAIVADEALNAALYGWVEGARPTDIRLNDIDAVLAFVTLLKSARSAPKARNLRTATEACLSLEELVAQIRDRRGKFDALAVDEPALMHFLRDQVDAVLADSLQSASSGADVAMSLAQEDQCLSPSDFGFHNVIRQPDGCLIFIDMEYFGWDDPVKLAADFVLHPGMDLDIAQTQRFVEGWLDLFDDGAEKTGARFRAHLSLYALRWTMILLNEFLPERWQSRVFSGQADAWEAAKNRQLQRAQIMLGRGVAALQGDILAGALDVVEC